MCAGIKKREERGLMCWSKWIIIVRLAWSEWKWHILDVSHDAHGRLQAVMQAVSSVQTSTHAWNGQHVTEHTLDGLISWQRHSALSDSALPHPVMSLQLVLHTSFTHFAGLSYDTVINLEWLIKLELSNLKKKNRIGSLCIFLTTGKSQTCALGNRSQNKFIIHL